MMIRGLNLHRFRPRLWEDRAVLGPSLARDAAAGLTVGIVALPLAMAFAIASGLPPEQGLAAAIVGGLFISLFGGSSVQIGGPAGAFIVVVYAIVERHGAAQLAVATLMAGVLMMVMGWLRLGVLVRFVPVPIIIGFTNGIAVLIAMSQLKEALGLEVARLPADFVHLVIALVEHASGFQPWALGLTLLSLAVVVIWPKAYRAKERAQERAQEGSQGGWPMRALAFVPGTLVALVITTAVSQALDLPVATIGSRFGGIPAQLPTPQWPAFDWLTLQQLLMPAVTLALLGAVESLLCARVADKLRPQAPQHEPNQELMAQGLANIAAPMFGGMPVTGTVARTVTNVRAGARTPVAGMVHALSLLLIMVVAAPLAEPVPLAALAGILLFVAWNMGEWREFARLRQFSLPYRITLLGTFALTVVIDLTVAVQVGLLLACGFFVWRMGQLFEVRALDEPDDEARREPEPSRVQGFELFGALFFGAVGKVEQVAERVAPTTRCVVLDLHRLISMDNTGLEAMTQLHAALARRDVALVLAAVNPQPLALIRRSGFEAQIGDGAICATRRDAWRLATALAARLRAEALPG